MTEAINVGDLRRVSVTSITNAAGSPADPTTLVLKVRKPAGTVTTYTYGVDVIVVRDSLGNFHADVPLDTEGVWRYDWIGTGAATFAEGSTFYCHAIETA